MDTLLDPAIVAPGDAEKLDPVAKLLRVFDIESGDMPDAFDMHRAEIDRAAEGDRSQDRQLMGRIDTVDVEAGI